MTCGKIKLTYYVMVGLSMSRAVTTILLSRLSIVVLYSDQAEIERSQLRRAVTCRSTIVTKTDPECVNFSLHAEPQGASV